MQQVGMIEIATIIGSLIALLAFVKGVIEYTLQGRQKRAEKFFEVSQFSSESESFKNMCIMLEDNDPKLAEVPFERKLEFLGYFEEIALMMNSGLIRKKVVHYMFSYFAIKCWDSDYFWTNVDRESKYWSLFRDFALNMKQVESTFKYSRRDFRF